MASTITRLVTHPKKFKPKCNSSIKNEALQVLRWECEDPWKPRTNLKGSLAKTHGLTLKRPFKVS
jgi:hypothetical protein